MRALVTGAAGFIGSHIAKHLLAQGDDVIGIDAFNPAYARELKEINLAALCGPRFDFVNGDINDIDLDFVEDVDVIYHQAGQPGVRTSWGQEFGSYVRNNVQATQRLLERTRTCQSLQKFVYASSSSVYGNAERYPTEETDVPQPVSPYGVTKLAGEHLVSLYASNFGVPTVSLRYFTVYGPGQRPDMAFTRFLEAAVTGGEITLFGSGNQVRDFTFVKDIVNANMLAAASTRTKPGEVINISGGTSISVNQVLEVIADLTGCNLNVRRVGHADGDVARTGGATHRATDLIDWDSTVSLRDGLNSQLQWIRSTQDVWAPLRANAA